MEFCLESIHWTIKYLPLVITLPYIMVCLSNVVMEFFTERRTK